MPDRVVEEEIIGVPEIDQTLQDVMVQLIEEATDHLTEEGFFAPFTALLNGDVISIDVHDGEDTEECYTKASTCVRSANGARAYAFCYDGFLETDQGEKYAIICEGGLPGQDKGLALALMYTADPEDDTIQFEEDLLYLGPCENFLDCADVIEDTQEDSDLIG